MKNNTSEIDDLFERADREREEQARTALWSALGNLYRWKRFIVAVTILGAVAAVAISLMLPNWYAASARVLPPEAGSANPLSAALMKNLPSAATSLLGGKTGDYARYLTILSSRRLLESAVDRFNLVEVYETGDSPTPREDAIEFLAENIDFPVDEEYEFLSVMVMDTDPERAAEMANFFVAELNRINADLTSESAGSYRRFVESRYDEALSTLDSVMTASQSFQQKYGLYDVPAQLQTFFQTLATLRASAVQNEITYEALRAQLGADNPQVQSMQDIVRAHNQKFQRVLDGQEQLLPVSKDVMPTVMRQYMELEREGMVQARILEVVGPMLEQARFDEEKKTEAVQIVDQAVPPVRKFWPRRSVIVVTTTLSIFLLSVIFVLVFEWWRRNHHYIAYRLQAAASEPIRKERQPLEST